MEEKAKLVDPRGGARDLLRRHCARYEVAPYYVVLDERTINIPANRRRIHAGFDLDLYGKRDGHGALLSFENGELRNSLNELCDACREVVAPPSEHCNIEIVPLDGTLVLDTKRNFEREALVHIRITHFRGLDQPAGASEEKVLADMTKSLDALGVKRT